MARLKLTLSYDGRAFKGWQSQRDGNTVQDAVEAALQRVAGAPIRLHGAGRTDQGVHALAQVAHFKLPEVCRFTPDVWRTALNANLPPAVRIMQAEPVDDNFHARFSAAGKVYQYRIWRGEVLPPWEAGLAWHLWGKLDEELLQQGATLLQGKHDFARLSAFRNDPAERARRGEASATTRELRQVALSRMGNTLALTFTGSGFLYKMVRILTGTLVHIARGRASLAWLSELLQEIPGQKSHHCAPPDGLYLQEVQYFPEKSADLSHP